MDGPISRCTLSGTKAKYFLGHLPVRSLRLGVTAASHGDGHCQSRWQPEALALRVSEDQPAEPFQELEEGAHLNHHDLSQLASKPESWQGSTTAVVLTGRPAIGRASWDGQSAWHCRAGPGRGTGTFSLAGSELRQPAPMARALRRFRRRSSSLSGPCPGGGLRRGGAGLPFRPLCTGLGLPAVPCKRRPSAPWRDLGCVRTGRSGSASRPGGRPESRGAVGPTALDRYFRGAPSGPARSPRGRWRRPRRTGCRVVWSRPRCYFSPLVGPACRAANNRRPDTADRAGPNRPTKC